MGSMTPLAALALWLFFVFSPLLAYLRAREVYGFVSRRGRKVIVIYYGAMLACIFLVVLAFTVDRRPVAALFDLLGIVAGIGIGVGGLCGPFVGIHLLSSQRYVSTNACAACGYNLTGNVSGVCPECGTSITANRLAAYPNQSAAAFNASRAGFASVGLILLFGALLSYAHATVYQCCSECGRRQVKTVHRMEVPVSGEELVEIDGRAVLDRKRRNPMTAYLDPDGTCRHIWITYGGSGNSIWRTSCGSRSDPSRVDLSDMPHFDAFVAANPDVLDQFRGNIRTYQWSHYWLEDRYRAWDQSRSRVSK